MGCRRHRLPREPRSRNVTWRALRPVWAWTERPEAVQLACDCIGNGRCGANPPGPCGAFHGGKQYDNHHAQVVVRRGCRFRGAGRCGNQAPAIQKPGSKARTSFGRNQP